MHSLDSALRILTIITAKYKLIKHTLILSTTVLLPATHYLKAKTISGLLNTLKQSHLPTVLKSTHTPKLSMNFLERASEKLLQDKHSKY